MEKPKKTRKKTKVAPAPETKVPRTPETKGTLLPAKSLKTKHPLTSAESLKAGHQRSHPKPLRAKRPVSVTPVAVDPMLSSYLREVSKYPIMSREEEHKTALEYYETKSREALQKLVTSNLRFVIKIAYEYIHYRMKLLDLIQEGNMGLLKAVQEFDPYKDVRLTTYAVWWIRSYIQDYVLRNYSLVKMGTTQAQKKLFYRLRREQRRLEELGISRAEEVKLLAAKLDVPEKEVVDMDQRLSTPDLSLNANVNEDGGKQFIQNVADPAAPPDQQLGEIEQKDLFKKILHQFGATLEGREKLIFQERLVAESPLTLQEIGDKYKVTKERARQLEEEVKGKLKQYVAQHYPDFNLLIGR